MVVDLTVDSEDDAVVGVGQGLGSRLWRNNRQLKKDASRPETFDLPTPTMLRRSWQRTKPESQNQQLLCFKSQLGLLVWLAITLPPEHSTLVLATVRAACSIGVVFTYSSRGHGDGFCVIQVNLKGYALVDQCDTYCFASFRAVGLNFSTSG